MNKVLDSISLCTFSTGGSLVREVLGDWLSFLGGRPAQVLFAITPPSGYPPVYDELRREGVIDRLIPVETRERSVREIDAEALRLVVDAAPTNWVLLLKLDTLPFRSGHDSWLEEAIQLVQRHELFGMTGGFLIPDLVPLERGYSVTQKYSNNFSIFRKAEWLKVIGATVDQGHDPAGALDCRFQGDNLRFINEFAIETYLQGTGGKMLVRHDSLDWSVFHVNVWGNALRDVRESYIRRRRVTRFFNTGKPQRRPLLYPWQKYYGFPRPPALRLMRIVLGRWRRELFGIKG